LTNSWFLSHHIVTNKSYLRLSTYIYYYVFIYENTTYLDICHGDIFIFQLINILNFKYFFNFTLLIDQLSIPIISSSCLYGVILYMIIFPLVVKFYFFFFFLKKNSKVQIFFFFFFSITFWKKCKVHYFPTGGKLNEKFQSPLLSHWWETKWKISKSTIFPLVGN